jgi:hypothetical protein
VAAPDRGAPISGDKRRANRQAEQYGGAQGEQRESDEHDVHKSMDEAVGDADPDVGPCEPDVQPAPPSDSASTIATA